MSRLLAKYRDEIVPALTKELNIKNPMAIPKLCKMVVSMGTGAPTVDRQRLPAATEDLSRITGQKPQVRRARKSVSNFKVREDMEIGCRVTLRGRRMYEFLDRLINTAIPRLRDFRGLNPRSFDGRGNYSMGVADQLLFPEIDVGKMTHSQGMNITFVTSARSDEAGLALLAHFGVPFRKN